MAFHFSLRKRSGKSSTSARRTARPNYSTEPSTAESYGKV
jgi:hypothetical protein